MSRGIRRECHIDNDVPNAFEPKVFDVEVGLLLSAAMWYVFAIGCVTCLGE
jgi:hypothetical protein